MRKGIIKLELIIICTFYLFTFSNCSQENENPSDILASKTWKIGIVDLNPSTNPPGDLIYHPVFNCDKDDLYKFDQEGNLIINRNTIKCDENELQIDTLTFSINRTAKELVISGINYTLAEESYSQVKYYINFPSGTNLTQNLVFLLQ